MFLTQLLVRVVFHPPPPLMMIWMNLYRLLVVVWLSITSSNLSGANPLMPDPID